MNQSRPNYPPEEPGVKKQKSKLPFVLIPVVLLFGIAAVLYINARAEAMARIDTLVQSATESAVPEQAVQPAEVSDTETPVPTDTAVPIAVVEPTAAPVTILPPEQWREWPIIPEYISDEMKEIYRAGLAEGRLADTFSKVGDSNSVAPYFLSCFDSYEGGYSLGEYAYLEETIEQFKGSFSRESRAAWIGATVIDMDNYHPYDDDVCWPYESALSCEYRLNLPSIAFIAFGTNDVYYDKELFDTHLRSLVQKSLDRMVVPILVTKTDNLEGDDSFNELIARAAYDFKVPLWNLWRAENALPNHGLREDNVHHSFHEGSLCDFSGGDLQEYGLTVRNQTALQALDAVWRLLNEE